jgi:hypothetical protein
MTSMHPHDRLWKRDNLGLGADQLLQGTRVVSIVTGLRHHALHAMRRERRPVLF